MTNDKVYYSENENLIFLILDKIALKDTIFVIVLAGSETPTWLCESDLNKFDLVEIGDL